MVTHDPVAASYSRLVVFLADGQVVGALRQPTPDAVLDRMRELGEPAAWSPAGRCCSAGTASRSRARSASR
jgi:putative ABC transport system ATP-binding protein